MEYSIPRILIVTATYKRPLRIQYLKRMAGYLKQQKNIFWILVEDGNKIDPEVKDLLNKSGIEHIYLNIGPTRDHATSQKDLGLRYIRDHDLEGIVYVADDDNYYDQKLFQEIRKTKKVSVFPVANLGPHGIEKPIVENGKIIGWDAYWKERKFPIDTGAFAFNAKLLKGIPNPIWKICKGKEHGGESEFLEKIAASNDDLEILCNDCKDYCVLHNLPLGWSVSCTMALRRAKLIVKKILFPFIKEYK